MELVCSVVKSTKCVQPRTRGDKERDARTLYKLDIEFWSPEDASIEDGAVVVNYGRYKVGYAHFMVAEPLEAGAAFKMTLPIGDPDTISDEGPMGPLADLDDVE